MSTQVLRMEMSLLLSYQVLNDAGEEVHRGDAVTDYLDRVAIFESVHCGPEFGMAKVNVTWPDGTDCIAVAPAFNLKVQTMCGVQGCGSVDHSTRDHNTEQRH
jgi:hypothetical protein